MSRWRSLDLKRIMNVNRSQLPEGDVKVGDMFHGPNGEVVTVTAISIESVTLDANHPLAGQKLIFDVEIDTVREATKEEVLMAMLTEPMVNISTDISYKSFSFLPGIDGESSMPLTFNVGNDYTSRKPNRSPEALWPMPQDRSNHRMAKISQAQGWVLV